MPQHCRKVAKWNWMLPAFITATPTTSCQQLSSLRRGAVRSHSSPFVHTCPDFFKILNPYLPHFYNLGWNKGWLCAIQAPGWALQISPCLLVSQLTNWAAASAAEGTALGLALGAAPTAPTRVSWWKNQHLGGESTEPLSPCELSLALTRLNFPALNRSEPPQASSD